MLSNYLKCVKYLKSVYFWQFLVWFLIYLKLNISGISYERILRSDCLFKEWHDLGKEKRNLCSGLLLIYKSLMFCLILRLLPVDIVARYYVYVQAHMLSIYIQSCILCIVTNNYSCIHLYMCHFFLVNMNSL